MRKETEEVGDRIRQKFLAARTRIVQGWVPRRDFLSQERRDGAAAWLKKQYVKVRSAIRDEDEILFERALVGWEKGFEKLNFICGETYRARYPNEEEWPLRYFRWMKIQYMKFECELGVFYIVPRMPKRTPNVEHWLTADEMIGILRSPGAIQAIKAFGLPVRPGSIPQPQKGEKHLICDYTKKPAEIYYDFQGAVKR